MFPSGSLNQATLSPVGAVQIPSSSCLKKPKISQFTPFFCRARTTFSIPETCQPRIVNFAGVKSFIFATRILIPFASSTMAKPSSSTKRSPSMPSYKARAFSASQVGTKATMLVVPSIKESSRNHVKQLPIAKWQTPLIVAEINHHGFRAEPVRFVSHVKQADRKPDSAHGLGQVVQVPPDQPAEPEADQRQNRVAQPPPLATRLFCDHRKLPEAGKVHPHEREKCPEIEQFARVLVGVADVIKKNRTGH